MKKEYDRVLTDKNYNVENFLKNKFLCRADPVQG
jgi:hypothetical protein